MTFAVHLSIRGFLRVVVLIAALVAARSAFAAQVGTSALAGHWEGALEITGTRLTTIFDFEQDAQGLWTGRISIPEQAAKDLPLDVESAQTDAVRCVIRGVPGKPTFEGKLASDGKISGVFTQGGAKGTFSIERKSDTAAKAADSLSTIDALVKSALKTFEVPGLALAIVAGGKVVHAAGYGLRNVEKNLPVTPRTLFAIGSSTKAFTTFVLGTLVDEGQFAWDDPARKFAPTLEFKDRVMTERITPRDLVTHRSGLPRHDLVWYNATTTRDDLVSRLKYLEPVKDLRVEWNYQNLMFLTAGWLTEKVTGGTWEDAVRQRVFVPLGMSSSNFSVVESQASADFALPYDMRDDALTPIPFRDISLVGPAGSINSNVEDMAKWVQVHLSKGKANGKQVIASATLEELHRPQMVMADAQERADIGPKSYAMGWFVDPYRGHARIHHGGRIDGFTALVTFLPNDDIGIVVLTNLGAGNLTELVTRHALDSILGLEPVGWVADAAAKLDKEKAAAKEAETKKDTFRVKGTKPSHALTAYAGSFVDAGYGVLNVELVGDALVLTYNGIRAELEPWHYDVFSGKPLKGSDPTFDGMRFLFTTGLRGDIDSVKARFEPSCEPIVFRRRAGAELSDPKVLAAYVGDFELQGETIRIELVGGALRAIVPGQPPYTLVPTKVDEFELKEYPVIHLRFARDAGNAVTEILFDQPNGVFTAKRKP